MDVQATPWAQHCEAQRSSAQTADGAQQEPMDVQALLAQMTAVQDDPAPLLSPDLDRASVEQGLQNAHAALSDSILGKRLASHQEVPWRRGMRTSHAPHMAGAVPEASVLPTDLPATAPWQQVVCGQLLAPSQELQWDPQIAGALVGETPRQARAAASVPEASVLPTDLPATAPWQQVVRGQPPAPLQELPWDAQIGLVGETPWDAQIAWAAASVPEASWPEASWPEASAPEGPPWRYPVQQAVGSWLESTWAWPESTSAASSSGIPGRGRQLERLRSSGRRGDRGGRHREWYGHKFGPGGWGWSAGEEPQRGHW